MAGQREDSTVDAELQVDLVVVPVSPLNAPGLMTAKGWDALRAADAVAASCAHPAWSAHLREAGVEATLLSMASPDESVSSLAAWLRADSDEADGGPRLAWLTDSEHPFIPAPPLVLDTLRQQHGLTVDADFVFASPVAPGAAVVESVRIMHELRSPGGDTWSAEQSHASLARYLLEETHEVLEELDRDPVDDSALVAEFGDLLFQLVFHARIGTESVNPWDLDAVARALNQKMYRRNPHVFSPAREQLSVDDTIAQWEAIKKQEKQSDSLASTHRGLGDGIPSTLPALQRAFKLVQRAQARGLSEDVDAVIAGFPDEIGRAIAEIVVKAAQDDRDPESSVRRLIAHIENYRAEQA